jgi:hypothetical protein
VHVYDVFLKRHEKIVIDQQVSCSATPLILTDGARSSQYNQRGASQAVAEVTDGARSSIYTACTMAVTQTIAQKIVQSS